MPVDWTEVNSRRIEEKTQELSIYCSHKKEEMTPRAFELARISLCNLLDNVAERNNDYKGVSDSVKASMDRQNNLVAKCSVKQAKALARTIVYKAIGDDLNLYPITAEQKLQRSKQKGVACHIPKEEMTIKDYCYVAKSMAYGENYSKQTMMAIFSAFSEYGMNPIMTRVYAVFSYLSKPSAISSLPMQSVLGSEYRKAANQLVEMGYMSKDNDGNYMVIKRLC